MRSFSRHTEQSMYNSKTKEDKLNKRIAELEAQLAEAKRVHESLFEMVECDVGYCPKCKVYREISEIVWNADDVALCCNDCDIEQGVEV